MSSPVMDLISTVPDDLPPRYGSDRSPTAIARVVSLIEGGRALNVSLYGGPPIQISATAVNLTGLATFGRQAEALGRITITAATLTLRPHPTAVAWSVQIAPATYTDTGPVTTGATISAPVQVGATVLAIDITRIAAQLLTPGTGLALVGQTYGGVQASGDSLSIRITYTSR